MSFARRFSFLFWTGVSVCALGFLLWISVVRLQRVEALSALPEWSVDELKTDATSLTGYTAGQRRLIVPEHNNTSYEWIMQTQQMLASGEWRVRRVDYDNAPYGRATHWPAPYRWWLGLLAWTDHSVSGRTLALSVEHAALYANPLLHFLMVAGAALFTARRFGIFSAALLSVGLVTLFPLAGNFLPGVPDQSCLAHAATLGSLLFLLAGAGCGCEARMARRYFFLAGLAGGFCLWISAPSLLPILVGVVLGALGAAWLGNRNPAEQSAAPAPVLPWRAWGLGGAALSLVAYLIEYFPSHLGWQLETNHPLYAFAWLGAAELLARAVAWIRGEGFIGQRRDRFVVTLAVAAVAAVPLAMMKGATFGVLARNPLVTRLSLLGDFAAPDVFAWISHDGFTRLLGATCLPLLLLVPAGLLLVRSSVATTARSGLALVFGPALLAVGFACFQLSWWSTVDVLLLVLLVAAAATTETARSGRDHLLWVAGLAVVTGFGVMQLLPERAANIEASMTEVDVEGLVGRDLAHWLAHRIGPDGAVVFAPPAMATALAFHGGLRGVGSFDWENDDGLAATVRLASATSSEEALALVQRRGIAYLVIPTWDDSLTGYDSLRSENSFVVALHRWALPAWLRPVSYTLPAIAGFEKQSVTVLEVVDEQETAVAFSRLAEYFVEMGQLDLATATRSGLQRFTGDIGALTARSCVELGLGERGDFSGAFNALLAALSADPEAALPWDRRVSLAIVLAQGKRPELAREQAVRCFAGLEEARLRSLSTPALFRLQMLGKRFGLVISDPKLQRLALGLLPPGTMRDRLAQ